MGVPGGMGGHAALGGAGRTGVRRGGRGPGALGPGSQSVQHRWCARADPSRGGELTQSPTLLSFRESPATWMGQLGPAAWTQTLRPQAVLWLLLNGSLTDARRLQQAQHHYFTVSLSQKRGCCF
ncbi:photoreceptor disk component PRCD isoform X3 [Sapajus apella]|uniref:Photoreceptor disk component PRCD isoform X3 n=1 Tax=Sapajus apella TaxID=9515 RepID=A0A6J3EX52_SAPAP|nr:photoreceptor disk component PRCD isoform X3 [Sapajus apella]